MVLFFENRRENKLIARSLDGLIHRSYSGVDHEGEEEEHKRRGKGFQRTDVERRMRGRKTKNSRKTNAKVKKRQRAKELNRRGKQILENSTTPERNNR